MSVTRRTTGALVRTCTLPLLAAFVLSGCGGGGGSGGTGKSCIDTVRGCLDRSTYDTTISETAEEIRSSPAFDNRWSLAMINLAEGWSHLRTVRGSDKPGSGVTVGMVDTGIDLDHPAFREGAAAGQVTERFLAGATDETGQTRLSHGTSVAGIIVGRERPQDRIRFTGIVPYATFKAFAIPLASRPAPDVPFDPVSLTDLAVQDDSEANLSREVLSHGLDVVNLSFGVQGLIENYRDVAALRATMGRNIEALAQSDRTDRTVLVWAAGNSHGRLCRPGSDNCVGDDATDHLGRPAGRLDASSPGLFAGLMARIPELRGHSVASVAVGEDGVIAPFSNRCGIAADWCIAAPGEIVWTTYFGPYQGSVIRGYARLSGTSFAAPMVTGGLALMKQFFRDQLSGEDLLGRLLRTADRSGRYADRAIYGQGLMDLDAALSPQGSPTLASGLRIGEAGIPLDESGLQVGAAFGDGPARAFSRQEIAAFDTLGAPFWYDLGHLVAPSALPLLDRQLRDFMAPPPFHRLEDDNGWSAGAAPDEVRFDMGRVPGGTGSGHGSLPRDALTFTARRFPGVATTAFTTEGLGEGSRPMSGASISWRPPGAPLGLRAGWLSERGSMLSSIGQGAFGDLAADSVFVGFDLAVESGGWRLGGGPEIGMVRPGAPEGIITDLDLLATSAFAFHLSRRTAGGGTLQFSLAQPLRVEDGDAVLSVPAGRTRDGAVLRRQFSADLAPTGRQFDLSVRWERPLAGGALRLGTVATRQPDHDAGAGPGLSLLAGWRASF